MRRILLMAALAAGLGGLLNAQTTLVSNGNAVSAILTPPNPKGYITEAAQELQLHLQLMSGATVPIDTVGHESSYPGKAFVYVGASSATTAAGISTSALTTEFYVIRTVGNNLYIVGKDGGSDNWPDLSGCQPATMFGVYHLLCEVLGVRWLWPGNDGIVVPSSPTITVPVLNITDGPAMVMRKYRMPRDSLYNSGATTYGSNGMSIPVLPASSTATAALANADALWLRRMRMGTRKSTNFGASETTWWSTYGTTHPEYFAVLPAGKSQPSPEASEVKLNVSLPAVWSQILGTWEANGKPSNLNLCPNDSRSFCICSGCLAWDYPSQAASVVFDSSSAQLGDRYARFYTTIANQVSALNPNATVYGYAYDVYQNAPYQATLPDNVALEYIPASPTDVTTAGIAQTQSNVLGWIAQGCTQMYLRPNWFLAAHAGPFAPIHRAANHYSAMLNGGFVLGLDSDSSTSSYSPFGLYYYTFCRLMANPGLTPDQIIAEYCSGFGSAASVIQSYFAYWETFIDGQADSTDGSILGWESCMAAYPTAYTSAVFAGAQQILNNAEATLAPSETAARARIEFLRVACLHGQLTAAAIALVSPTKTLAQNPAAEAAMRQLLAVRDTYAGTFAIWREWMIDRESYGVPNMNTYWTSIFANPTPTAPAWVSVGTAAATTAAPFAFQLIATNRTSSYSATNLPAGLAINAATGVISGTPAASGTTLVAIGATNAVGTTASSLALTVTGTAPVITSAGTASGLTGSAFSFQVAATNSATNFQASPLPAGLAIDGATGVISGTPTIGGATPVTLTVSNASGSGTATLVITLTIVAPTITSGGTASGLVDTAFSYQITASSGPTSFGASPLPAGLTVDSATGLISGSPTAPGSTPVQLSATNSVGTGDGSVTITVATVGDLYAGANAASSDNWNTPNTSTSAKWATAASPSVYVPPTSGNDYHANGFNLKAGDIGTTPPAAAGSSAFAGQTLMIDGYNAASGQASNTAQGLLNCELSTSATGPKASPTAATQGGFTAAIVTAPLSVPVTLGMLTTTMPLRAIQGGTGITTLNGTLELDGDTQLKLPSGVTDMAFLINSAVTGTGRIEASGGTSGGTTMAGYAVWSFSHLSGDNATRGSGWQGTSINVTNKHTLGFTADTNLFVTNPEAVLEFSKTSAGFLELNANLSVGPGKFMMGSTALANGVYTVASLNALFPGFACAGSYAAGNLSATDTNFKVYVGQPIGTAPAIAGATSAPATAGIAFSYQITASGSPTSYAALPLPDGLSVDPVTGLISGFPTTAGVTTVTLGATNAAGTGTGTLTILVAAAILPPAITSGGNATGTVGVPFSFTIAATNSPTDFEAAPLPDGLAIDPTSGVISGVPTTAGSVVASLQVTNDGGAGGGALTIAIAPAAPVITSPTTVAGTVGSAFSYQIAATNLPTSYAASPLPAGLSVDPATGIISGTPGAVGATAATVTATNATGTGTAVVTIGITASAPVITSAPTTAGAVATAFSYQIAATNSPSSYGATGLPTGLTVNAATGAITGTPSAAGTTAVTVSATNAAGSGSATVTLIVVPAPPAAAHAVVAVGYVPGQGVTITNTLTYTGAATSLTWSILPPVGWSFASAAGTTGSIGPAAGQTGELDWNWGSPPPSPVTFTYTLNVPATQSGTQAIAALAVANYDGAPLQTVARPDPLPVALAIFHSADEDHDGTISFAELVRVIELYVTTNGTTRSGAYVDQSGTEDGFAPDPSRAPGQAASLPVYHSADEDKNGAINLSELIRVIVLYDYRSGSVRTGQYHDNPVSEDGFDPGP